MGNDGQEDPGTVSTSSTGWSLSLSKGLQPDVHSVSVGVSSKILLSVIPPKEDAIHARPRPHLDLRARIVWFQPSRLAQGRINYTNNYDVICYFVKGRRPKTFDLDAIRVGQLVELEHRLRCEHVPSVVNGKFGKTKFNGNGKNPGDVWGDIKQLTYRSKELVSREALNTIQKPEKLMERLIKASSAEGDVVLDPFAGVGTCPVVCRRLGRHFIGIEKHQPFVAAANARLEEAERQSAERLFQPSVAREIYSA